MRVSRFYLPHSLDTGDHVAVRDERAHYLRDVLRLRVGANLTVFNGQGGEFDAVMAEVGRRVVLLEIGEWHDRDVESPLKINLGLGIARGDRMDWAVQKAVECGVHVLIPLVTEHCHVHFQGDRGEHKRQHWKRIAVGACEQCGRNRIPEIRSPQLLDSWLNAQNNGIVFHPEGIPFPSLAPPTPDLTLLIGPEGGLSGNECRQARKHGFIAAHLGPRILRMETAVVAALSLSQGLWGDGQGGQ